MSKTSGMIMTGSKRNKEFCFVVKPSPGSRKTVLVSEQQIPEIEDMIFISNFQMLVKFRNGKSVTFKADGSVIDYESEVLTRLLDNPKWLSFAG